MAEGLELAGTSSPPSAEDAATSCPEFRSWVKLATGGRSYTDRQRIHEELEAYFAEAYGRHIADGLSPERAMTRVVLSLGDPRDAAKTFARHYHLGDDLATVESLRKLTWRRPGLGLLNWVVILFYLVPPLTCPRIPRFLLPTGLAICIVFTLLRVRLVRRLAAQGRFGSAVAANVALHLLMIAALAPVFWFSTIAWYRRHIPVVDELVLYYALLIVPLVTAMVFLLMYLPTLRRLKRAEEPPDVRSLLGLPDAAE